MVKAGGDDHVVAIAGEAAQGLLHEAFGFRVQGAGGLVQKEDGRILQDGARERQALALATDSRKPLSPITVSVALGLVRMMNSCAGCCLRRQRRFPPHWRRADRARVARDGIVEQRHFLADDGNGVAQARKRRVPQGPDHRWLWSQVCTSNTELQG